MITTTQRIQQFLQISILIIPMFPFGRHNGRRFAFPADRRFRTIVFGVGIVGGFVGDDEPTVRRGLKVVLDFALRFFARFCGCKG